MSGMAEVLAGHVQLYVFFAQAPQFKCKCGERIDDFHAHVAEALTAAGFGPVKEAAAVALEEAAAIVTSEENDQWRRAKEYFPGSQIVAQRMQIIGKIIRARAAAVRVEG